MANQEVTQSNISSEQLADRYWEVGSKDKLAKIAISETVDALVAVGVSKADIVFHLDQALEEVKKG